MTQPQTLYAPPARATSRLTVARTAAVAAAACLLAGGAVALAADPVALADHSHGLGALSEALTGVAFLAGASALAILTPVTGWLRVLWLLAPFGLAVGGLTMMAVPVARTEPPTWLFLSGLIPSFIGLIAVGALGTKRVWPWWVGLGLALFLPIMFLVPFNSIPMAAVWVSVAVGYAVREHPGTPIGTTDPDRGDSRQRTVVVCRTWRRTSSKGPS